jgi:hypothetical protein
VRSHLHPQTSLSFTVPSIALMRLSDKQQQHYPVSRLPQHGVEVLSCTPSATSTSSRHGQTHMPPHHTIRVMRCRPDQVPHELLCWPAHPPHPQQ